MSTAWREVFPASTMDDRNAGKRCSEFLAWYEQEYPPTFDQAANAYGLHPYRLMGKINELLESKKWAWNKKAGVRVETDEPNGAVQLGAFKELVKLIGKSELWRRQFLEQAQNKPTELVTTPEFNTVEEFEEWAKSQNILKQIADKRKDATEARDRRLAEEGRLPAQLRSSDN